MRDAADKEYAVEDFFAQRTVRQGQALAQSLMPRRKTDERPNIPTSGRPSSPRRQFWRRMQRSTGDSNVDVALRGPESGRQHESHANGRKKSDTQLCPRLRRPRALFRQISCDRGTSWPHNEARQDAQTRNQPNGTHESEALQIRSKAQNCSSGLV